MTATTVAQSAPVIRGEEKTQQVERRRMPGVVSTGVGRGVAEIRVFFRNRTAVVMSMALPVALMLLFGSIFKMKVADSTISMRDVVVAGVLASGVMSAAFGSMATGIALESGDGTLKRLRGTPFTTTSYFLAKTVLILTLALVQTFVVLALAVAVFHFSLPTTVGRWFTFAWVFALGSLGTAFLGISVGSLVTDRRSIAGAVQFPFVLLQFVSGVYYAFGGLPKAVQYVGAFFPLKWMAQGMRAALLPDSMAVLEPAHSWELGRVALVLGAWVIGGFVLCLATRLRRIRRDFL
ncbi:ABC transporter permease [Kitasatospora sp. GP82]|uniref:ABC transporter permease n=1 Tax=Kitasatospora sp. GP82 TaxID=3035089 RepID=UPI00247430E2|nr:ABC transporter permease [Kitasatospora sp. GP82]MDH6130004.1 ABC-2 type transport system permease protein [Kitasatospora sp. GP82]